jgi:hypothetical protein
MFNNQIWDAWGNADVMYVADGLYIWLKKVV